MERLSDAAYLALRTLREQPYRDTPDLIVKGRYAVREIDVAAVEAGLRELERRGLARRTGYAWELTEAPEHADR